MKLIYIFYFCLSCCLLGACKKEVPPKEQAITQRVNLKLEKPISMYKIAGKIPPNYWIKLERETSLTDKNIAEIKEIRQELKRKFKAKEIGRKDFRSKIDAYLNKTLIKEVHDFEISFGELLRKNNEK